MIELPTPSVDDGLVLRTALTRAGLHHGHDFSATVDTVLRAYGEYLDVVLGGAATQTLTAAEAAALQWCFSLLSDGRRLSFVREHLMQQLPVKRCPYCGVGRPRALDHYLPKSTFPSYSIYSWNLIPCCSDCNTRKSKKVGTGSARFIHPYFDKLPSSPLLVAELNVLDDTIEVDYTIQGSPESTVSQVESLRFHFDNLGLRELFSDEAVIKLSNLTETCEVWWGLGGAANVSSELKILADGPIRRLGTNNWETAILVQASMSTAFCDGGFRLMSSARSSHSGRGGG